MRFLPIALLIICGCDYVPKSDHSALELRVASLAELNAHLEARVDTLEAVLESDVILNTEVHTSSIHWPISGGEVKAEPTWRLVDVLDSSTRGGFKISWTNNTNRDLRIDVAPFVFEDAAGIQIAEYQMKPSETMLWFYLNAGESHEYAGNFTIPTSVTSANTITRISLRARFSDQ